jgi:hypothetical protein
MLKLQDVLHLKEYRPKPKYRPTRRFWYFLLIVIAYIIIALLDKPDSYFTSVYWRG